MNDTMPAAALKAIIARLEAADYGIVMVAPGYSRAELIADLRAIAMALDDGPGRDARRGAGRSEP